MFLLCCSHFKWLCVLFFFHLDLIRSQSIFCWLISLDSQWTKITFRKFEKKIATRLRIQNRINFFRDLQNSGQRSIFVVCKIIAFQPSLSDSWKTSRALELVGATSLQLQLHLPLPPFHRKDGNNFITKST